MADKNQTGLMQKIDQLCIKYNFAPSENNLLRDWSKSMGGGGGGPEQRGGGSSVFEPLVRGGSCNF